LPHGLLDVYAGKTIDAIVTKMDLPGADLEQVTQLLREAGITGQIFPVSYTDQVAMARLRAHLLQSETCVTEPS
jgi:ethanolamine utilization protein EutP (predicted NTPase)